MSIAINGIDSYLGAMAASNAFGAKLSDKLDRVSSDNSNSGGELLEVCKEFEAYFLEQVYKEMFKSVDLFGSEDSSMSTLLDYYKDNMVQELASQTTEQSGGKLAQQLYEQMKRNYHIEE